MAKPYSKLPEVPDGVLVPGKLPQRGVYEEWEQVVPCKPGVGGMWLRTDAEPSKKMQALANKRKGQAAARRFGKLSLTEMLNKALKADDGYWAQRVVNGLILKAAKGNPAAQKVLWERAEGVLKEQVEVSGNLQFQKQVVLTDLREIPALPIEAEVVDGSRGT